LKDEETERWRDRELDKIKRYRDRETTRPRDGETQ
jgi:hypothetical protein